MKHHITKGSVLDDLGLNLEEARNLKMRAVLMRELEVQIKKHGWTQTQAAKVFCITQEKMSDLICGKIEDFPIDILVKMLPNCVKYVALVIDDRIAA